MFSLFKYYLHLTLIIYTIKAFIPYPFLDCWIA